MMNITQQKITADNLSKALFIYALICLVVAFILSFNSGKEIKQTVSMVGGQVGPLQVVDNNTVYLINVRQNVSSNSWSFITVDLLDANKQYLFSFGDEMWHESGYDSDGGWTESTNEFDMKVTFPNKGLFYLSVGGEKSTNNRNASVTVTVNKKVGSSLAFSVVGILCLILAVGIWFFENKEKLEQLSQ